MVKGEDPISIREWPEETKDLEELCEDAFHFYEVPKTKANRYPDVRIREEILEMDENFYSQYSQIEENLEEDFPNLEDLPRTEKFIVRLRQALLRIPDSGKVNFTIDHILETLKKKPKARIVVYSNFVESGVVNIGVLLEKYEISYGLITGSVPKKQRQKIIDDYNTGKLRVLLISKAAQRGIDLKETTSMIILDVPWNPASLEQAIGRVARYQSHSRLPEKDQKVDVYILYTIKPQRLKIADEKPSADIMMKRIIESKLEKSEEFTQMLKNVSVNFR
jgi:SNF2 family DNA or RNA helicase